MEITVLTMSWNNMKNMKEFYDLLMVFNLRMSIWLHLCVLMYLYHELWKSKVLIYLKESPNNMSITIDDDALEKTRYSTLLLVLYCNVV